MSNDINIYNSGADDTAQKARQWVNVRQKNKCNVKIKQDPDQKVDQEETEAVKSEEYLKQNN
ncbi:MAG TPA: hypothetical protein VIM29_13790 [Bacillota bacterium]